MGCSNSRKLVFIRAAILAHCYDAVSTGIFSFVQGFVRAREKRAHRLLAAVDGDADGNRYTGHVRKCSAFGLSPHALGASLRAGHVGARQDDEEFLAAEAAMYVDRAQLRRNESREFLQDLVARGMAVAVVDGLEAVDVDQADGVPSLSARDCSRASASIR